MTPTFAKAFQIIALSVFAFILGGYTFLLSGGCTDVKIDGWAWIAVVATGIGVAVNAFTLMRQSLKTPA